MQELNGRSPNQMMKQNVSCSKAGSEWWWELKNYITRKDEVDKISLSWTVNEKKFWPQADDSSFTEHHSFSSHVKSALGWGTVLDDHSTGRWCSKGKVGDLRHYIQWSFLVFWRDDQKTRWCLCNPTYYWSSTRHYFLCEERFSYAHWFWW